MACPPSLFVARQLELLEREREEAIAQTELLRTCRSPQTLQRHGLALLALQVIGARTGLGGQCLLELGPAVAGGRFPPHQIRPNDVVLIERNDGTGDASGSKSGVVWRISDARLIVALDTELPDGWGDRCRVATQPVYSTVLGRMRRSLQRLQRRIEENDAATLLDVLLRGHAPRFDYRVKIEQWLDPSLNASQRAAVQLAISADHLALVHGPPGTGKTYTLTEIIRQYVQRGKRVLVCGPSNLSVDNLAERLAPHKIPMVRLGHPARALPSIVEHTLDAQTRNSDGGAVLVDVRRDMDAALARLPRCKKHSERRNIYNELRQLRKEYRRREAKLVEELVGNARIILCTLSGADSRQLQGQTFDVVVIDEAAQALEAECWIAMHRANCVILAGDHRQLPPTVLSNRTRASVERSVLATSKDPAVFTLDVTLFDRMLAQHGDTVKRMLSTQYRMHQDIMAFPSLRFYANELTADDAVRARLLSDMPGVDATDDTTIPLLWIDTAGCGWLERVEEDVRGRSGDSRFNPGEAGQVVRHVRQLVEAGLPAESIAVITPYNAQVAHLRDKLRERYPQLEIGSVDGFQGREKDAVIVSLVRSNDTGDIGFLADYRRTNVAITRPRRHLCIIGDSETVGKSDQFYRQWYEWMTEHAEIRYADANDDGEDE
ncbi:immunoglobulin mu binding protein 2 [Syncephalis pseudoplumigaleata]|uniref:DNA helicase n=1 Tax=Syncephalis pseudoplumigaleata TaxID=1712513 RepID=A0A4P9Z340_9FUNG|nr:immunoglobulin mu binding protein 2 [Syncephalis pseudoplumigaleata]|eukprot:RKP26856.1 immunoglobulin mu binding protein 2 [Syncephalis pseudoplumigaleata]